MLKVGYIGLIGMPNAGKSSLLNRLVQDKISIVTDKPQTTRRRVLGLVSTEKSQLIFVDAPGIIGANHGLNAFLEKEAEEVMADSDVLLAVLSLKEKEKTNIVKVLDMVSTKGKKWAAVVTHSDLQEYARRLPIIEEMVTSRGGRMWVIEPLRQEKQENLDEMLAILTDWLPESPQPFYDPESLTPHSVRDIATEIIREKGFECLHHELPYSLAVRIEKFDESSPTLTKIYAHIMVSRESHKLIVIGSKAATIKKIGTESRLALEKLLQTKVFLDLKVIVRENWMDNQRMMQELGYFHPKKDKSSTAEKAR